MAVDMQTIVSLAKRRGFVFPGSDIYGGLGGTWDYGPLGAELKRNIKNEFWKTVVQQRSDVVGLDAAIMMNPKVWEASGHVEAFTDPLMECKTCHRRFRADHLQMLLEKVHQKSSHGSGSIALSSEEREMLICYEKPGKHEFVEHDKHEDFTEPRKFHLMVKSYLGVVEGQEQLVYLRPEITQGVHVNFKNVLDSSRVQIPFGVAQIGKAFRNEITPGNFTFRSREFEQMELQFYISPTGPEGEKWFEYWKKARMDWYLSLGIKEKNLHFRDHEADEKAHYARAATDIEYNSPFGWKEFEGIHHRGDWDLSRHEKFSGQSMRYRDQETNEEYIPWVIETSGGVDRAALFFLIDAYSEENDRVILKLHPKLAPYKVAVFPLVANKKDILSKAREVYDLLKENFPVAWDDRGNIGKRYYSQDEIGTPWCVTIDYKTLEDNTVTVRDRDTAAQERIEVDKLLQHLQNYLK